MPELGAGLRVAAVVLVCALLPPALVAAPAASSPSTPEPGPATRLADLQANRSGIFRLTYEVLLAAGVDLNGVPADALALTNQGATVPIRVVSGRAFGPGGYLEFLGEALDTIYTSTNVYTLWLDLAAARRIAEDSTPPFRRRRGRPAPGRRTAAPGCYMETAVVNRQLRYGFNAPGNDPWFDSSMLAYRGSPKAREFTVELDHVVAGPASVLAVELWGVTDFASAPDHHVTMQFNGSVAVDVRFDGTEFLRLSAPLAPQQVRSGTNTLTVAQPADLAAGVDYDLISLDRWSVTYPRAFVARQGVLSFTASGPVFRVGGLGSDSVTVYRLDNGVPVLLSGAEAAGGSVAFSGTPTEATYRLSTVEALLTPAIVPARHRPDLNAGVAQYLVIAHGDFIGPTLEPLLEARRAQGLAVKVVDVDDIYAEYAHGIFGAAAIHAYIQYAAANLGTEYVLLVGGDTYDYRNFVGAGSLCFIPSLYAATVEMVRWAPVDPLYADTDGDQVPDLAIGRLPVRTDAELAVVVSKTLAYAHKDYGQTGVFSSDQGYGGLSRGAVAQMPVGWTITTASIDEQGLTAARSALIAALNRGVALAVFVGHSDANRWTRLGLFDREDAAALTNRGRPTVVTQWGCWNTYAVDPKHESLGHALLLSGSNGAAAVLGATALSHDYSERALSDLLTPRMTRPGMTIGAALQEAKAELAAGSPHLTDVLLGWTLLGDPALLVQP